MLLKKFMWYVEVFSPYLMAAKCKTLSSVVWYFVVIIKYVDVASSVRSLPPWDKHILIDFFNLFWYFQFLCIMYYEKSIFAFLGAVSSGGGGGGCDGGGRGSIIKLQ